ncbi:hypothetical protein WN943_014504 [Citrus x changshan-huyou]
MSSSIAVYVVPFLELLAGSSMYEDCVKLKRLRNDRLKVVLANSLKRLVSST